jgi:uncharacterized membrane protein YoaK (UPF0700 family)
MFAHFGAARTDRHDRRMAAYLACVAGCVNAVGIVLVGSPTSHVTGNVARLAADLARGDPHAATSAALMVFSFFAGAAAAAWLTEASTVRRTPFAYGIALACEAMLLGAFSLVANAAMAAHPRVQDAAALFLCIAMGVQNSLVTRISGAVVRTTHLTGVVTDLGIETARWYRWYRTRLESERPQAGRILLLGTIAFGFAFGAFVGARLAIGWHERAMLVPTIAVAIGSGYAVWSGRRIAADSAAAARAAR